MIEYALEIDFETNRERAAERIEYTVCRIPVVGGAVVCVGNILLIEQVVDIAVYGSPSRP